MDLVCRTCLNIIKDGSVYTHMNYSNPNEREKLEACVPEMTLDIVLEPLICNRCEESLSIAFSFKKQCMETEKALFSYIQRRRHNENCTDLLSTYDLLTLAKSDVILEHNYSTYKTEENYIHSIGNDSPADLQAFIKATLSTLAEAAKQKEEAHCCDDDEVVFDVFENVVNHETVHSYEIDLKNVTTDSIVKDAGGAARKVKRVRSSRSKTIPKHILGRKYFTRQRPLMLSKGMRKVIEGNKENVGKRRFRCTKCKKGVRCKCNLNSRKKLDSSQTCGKSFSEEKNLEAHQLTHGQKSTFQCSSCKRCLASQAALARHLKVHAGKRQRSKAFPKKIQRTNTDVGPYDCNSCKLTFTQKSHLIDHMGTHENDKPYECPKCLKRFTKSNTLRVHEQIHEDKPYQCHGCKKFFRDLSGYRRHVGKYLPKCVAGRELFNTEQDLKSKSQSKVLEEIDKDINEINREIAGDLANKEKLRRLKYFCKLCYKGFTTNFSRNRHVKFQHGVQ